MFPGDGRLFDREPVNALAVHEGELYIGGEFDGCMNRLTWYVARWNGRRWAPVGAGLFDPNVDRFAYALVTFDDPNTPEGSVVYAGCIDGVYSMPDDPDDPNEAWPLVAATNGPVRALAVYDGALYTGGEFTTIGQDPNEPVTAWHIAKWRGTGWDWEAVGGGVGDEQSGAVLALTVFDDGGGEALFAGGTFMTAGGAEARRVARWRDNAWSALGGGVQQPSDAEVDALAGWPATGRLYVGGKMTLVGESVAVRGIAAAQCDPNDTWTWSALGAGVWLAENVPGTVRSLAVLEMGGAEALYVGGKFVRVDEWNDNIAAGQIALWDGEQWSSLGEGFTPVGRPPYALAAYNDGRGLAVYAGGGFSGADGLFARSIASLKDAKWAPLGRAPNEYVFALCGVEAWHHPRLFVAGSFNAVGGLPADRLASWDGTAWRSMGGELGNHAHALIAFDEGAGPYLYIGGGTSFLKQGEGEGEPSAGYIARGRMVEQAPNVWKWEWTNTVDPEDPSIPITCDDAVCAFAAFQDVNDPEPMLYAAGEFTQIEGQPARYVACWNGQSWQEVGDPNAPNHPQVPIYALVVYDPSGALPALCAGSVGGVYKWQNNTWSQLLTDTQIVYALAAYQQPDEVQPVLYAGGNESLKKWTGGDWEPLLERGWVLALHVYDDGRGPALYVGGWGADPVGKHFLMRWDGQWGTVAEGPGDHVYALATLHDGLSERPALYAGGHFVTAGNESWAETDSQYIARWGCLTACRADLNNDGSVNFGDINPFVLALSNPAGYAAAYPGLAETDESGQHFTGGLVLFLGDLNCDGSVNLRDINPFVVRLTEGCCDPNCGPCPPPGDGGTNGMNGGPLSPEELAAVLAANVDPDLYDSPVMLVGQNAAQQETPEDAAYWKAVYYALIQ
jgi:hypothetical protein